MKAHPPLTIHMIGNAHLDPVWLWPWQAGVDEVVATFRSAADRCDEYPEFIFTRGESWCYEWVERLDPPLFRRVQKLVGSGQWHITGGQYLQPDCNLPTAMGLRRCIARGQQFFRDRFGVSPKVGFNVDSFGHAGTLPDIYGEFGYVGYCFQRPRPPQMPLPGQCFRWEGLNGGSLLAFRIIPLYVTRTEDLWGQITLAIEAADPGAQHVMCFYGVGNHGGGPTKANIEYIMENRDFFPGARLEFSTPERYFECIRHAALPAFRGELQHTFPGCYSVMHDIKQEQFKGEHLLGHAADLLQTFGEGNGAAEARIRLDAAWDDLLFTQFHDILAGTSARDTWASCRAMQGRARIVAEEVILEHSRRWALREITPENAQRLVLLNPSGEPFSGLIEAEPYIDFDRWGDRWIADEKGRRVAFQLIQPDGSIRTLNRILFDLEIPPGEKRILTIRRGGRAKLPAGVSGGEAAPRCLSNGLLSAALRPRGSVASVTLGRNVFAGFDLCLREDTSDTWTMLTDSFTGPVVESFRGSGWVREENGPLRFSVRNSGVIGRSPATLWLRACPSRRWLQAVIEIVWSEREKILCLRHRLGGAHGEWTAAVPGGKIRRPAGKVEWPVQGWAAVSSPGQALGMVSPDAYSASMRGKSLEWTLLRSPEMAYSGALPAVHHGCRKTSDQGFHRFEFYFCYGGRPDTALYDRMLRQSVRPPVVFDHYLGMNRPPWGGSPPRTLWLAAEHRARAAGRMQHLVDDGGPANIDDDLSRIAKLNGKK